MNHITQVMDTAFVDLPGGNVAVIDAADIDRVSSVSWHENNGYGRTGPRAGRSYMHHFILGWNGTRRVNVDHINRDKLDNRRSNLRIVSVGDNNNNFSPTRKNNRSGHCGIFWDQGRGRWLASARVNGKSRHIGRFVDQDDAITARDRWVIANRDEHATTIRPRSFYTATMAV